MKKYLLLTLFLPLFSFGQQCDTIYPSQYADTIIYCITNISCHDTCDGRIEITVIGPNQPYSFDWPNDTLGFIAGGNVKDSLCANQYIILIKDGNGNPVNTSSHVNSLISPPNFTLVEDSVASPSCFNDSDGVINLTIGGATPPYTYNWENGTNTLDRDSLSSGTYILTTTDANGCIQTFLPFDLENPAKVNSTTITDTLSCIDACDGEAIVIPSDGFTPYSFLWDDPLAQTTATATGLCYGLSTIYITDSMGCLDTNTVFIENPDTLKLSNITIDSACYQICDGQLSVTIEGGTGPYNVSWNFGGIEFNNTDTITEDTLCPGSYQLIFSDDNNCIDTADIILIERDPFNLVLDIYPDSCFNSCHGSAVAQLLNPNSPPFNYDWTSWTNNPGMIIGPDTDSISDLCSDSIRLVLTDVRGCLDTFYRFVDEPDILSFDSVLVKNNTCYNDGTGSISVDVSGGTGTISTLWTGSGGPYTTEDISNLNSGSYTLHIEDQNFCVKDTFFTVTEPDSLFATSSSEPVSCYNYSDGVIDVNIQGGTTPYIITWDLVLSDSTYIDSLVAGDYIYTISDSNGCIFQDTAFVSHPDELIISDTITNVSCYGDSTGFIDLTITGGTPAYSYLWSNSDTTQDLLNIGGGTYTVLVTDNQGCTENGTYSITEPQFPINSAIGGTDILCNGYNTGVADLTVAGGTFPYSYLWSNAEITEDIDTLIAGTYDVIISDSNNCLHFDTIIIIESALITITYNETSVLCNGDSTGSVDLTVSGGVGPYTYLWNTGDITQNLDSIPAGTYSVTVTDINLCPEIFSLNVSEPSELVSLLTNTNIDCYGNNNGSIDLAPSGGVGNYSFLWSNNESTEDINNLDTGTYLVELSDGNGCIIFDSATITEPTELIITSSFENSICNGGESGSIDITATGGTGALSYIWSNGSNSEDLNNIPAGNYTVDVTDDNDCEITYSYLITEPDALLLDYTVKPASCEEKDDGAIYASATGGTLPISYDWSNGEEGQDILDLSKGVYSLQVEDANGCTLPLEAIEVNFDGFDGCIEIPSGFTPNGDGIHDEWSIYGLYYFADVVVNVYNRWGQEMYSSKGYTIPWDGKYQGVDLPTATYYYVIQLTDSEKVFNGTVTIKR